MHAMLYWVCLIHLTFPYVPGELGVYNNAVWLIELVVSLEMHDVDGRLVKLVSVVEIV
jgi:hypothetical protein